MTAKLRVVVFTAGSMSAIDREMYTRLAADPQLDLAAIVVDDYRRRPKPLRTRIARAIAEDGLGWIAFKIGTKVRSMADRAIERAVDRIHGQRREEQPLNVPVHHVADIHSDNSLALIRSLRPDLGMIVGGRILRDSVITIPSRGTLNIHKRKLPEYRGGGPVGYWEILAGESSIGVSIHYATSDVDAGAVVAQATIAIEQYDTLETLKLKADVRGAQLYCDAIRLIAEGRTHTVAQDASRATTYRAPSDYKVWRLEKRLARNAPKGYIGAFARIRVIAQFLLLLPLLQRTRGRLVRERRAPVAIFFYHLVAGRPLNHMTLPLGVFARQIEFLRRYYRVLPLDAAVATLRSGANDAVAASITFDDGYRDNGWAIEYLRWLRIPATFFVSIGHVHDGSAFEHDRRRGFQSASPMTDADVRQLAADGFTVGSHAVHHEDFGTLTASDARRILAHSSKEIEACCGERPRYFAFPKGQRGVNITSSAHAAALEQFDAVFGAYGGCSYPQKGRRHFVRQANPTDVLGMHLAMSGYTGLRDVLRGNAWGTTTDRLDPRRSDAPMRVAIVSASRRIVGGHSVQAAALQERLRDGGCDVSWIPVDIKLPSAVRALRYVRTVINESLYIPSLLRIARADIVHIFAASYWSFMLGPAPALVAAKLFRKRAVLHYHSGEADDHLTRWRRIIAPLLRLADAIVVPSSYLQRIFATHGYETRVIRNVVDATQFRFRERGSVGPRLLSVRNLEDYYNIENTIGAFALVKELYPDATLMIAGHGSRESHLRTLASKYTGITFLGAIDKSQLPAVYDAADIFVNSSILDNQPVSILEAFASGLPVVSTPTGDIAAMLCGGEAGLLVPPRDRMAMATAIARLIEDPALVRNITRRAAQELQNYDAARIGDQWIALYDRLRSVASPAALEMTWNPEN